MREEIKDSIDRMDKDDVQDVAITFGIEVSNLTKTKLKQLAFADEDIAEYVLNY